MKRFMCLFILLCFCVSMGAFASSTAIVTKLTGAKGSTVRMREEPNGKVLVNVPFGSEVEVLGEQGEWFLISYEGRSGWMKKEFLTLVEMDEGVESFRYERTLKLYSSALLDEDFWEHFSEEEVNLFAIQDYMSYGGTLRYSVHDINKDGYDELLVAYFTENDWSIIDIYTTDGIKEIRLFGERSFGYRDNIDVLADGCLYTHGSNGADNISFQVYSFSNNGLLEEKVAIDFSGNDLETVERLRQRYDDSIVDAGSLYTWTIMAENGLNKPDSPNNGEVFFEESSEPVPEINLSNRMMGISLERFLSAYPNAIPWSHKSIAVICGMDPQRIDVEAYAVSYDLAGVDSFGFIDGRLVYFLTGEPGDTIQSLFPIDVDIPEPRKRRIHIIEGKEIKSVPIYIWKMRDCYMIVRMIDGTSWVYSVLYCCEPDLVLHLLNN